MEFSGPAIQLERVSKTYPGRPGPAVREMSVTIAPGEFFGLLGPNGAGKTTLISILCGWLTASAGRALIHGQAVPKGGGQVRKWNGLVPQDIALDPSLTAEE